MLNILPLKLNSGAATGKQQVYYTLQDWVMPDQMVRPAIIGSILRSLYGNLSFTLICTMHSLQLV